VKQRIVGALVLISLAAIIVPIVMDFHKDDSVREKPIGIPPKPKDFSVQVLPLEHSDKSAARQTPAGDQASPPGDNGDRGTQPHVEAPPPSDTTALVSAPSLPEESGKGASPQAWDVQVGSFSSQENAQALRDKLRSQHYTAYVEKVVLDSGHDRYRVRVGPEVLHADAEKLQKKLELREKLHGIVVSH